MPQSFEFSEELKGLYMRWNILPPCNLFPFDSKKQFWKMWCHWLACTICSKASGGWYTNQHHWMFLNVPCSQNNWKTCFYCIALDYKKKNIPFLLQFLFFFFFFSENVENITAWPCMWQSMLLNARLKKQNAVQLPNSCLRGR